MSRERKHINDINYQDLIGRWDAEPNEYIERIFIRDLGNIEVIQKSSLLKVEVNLNIQTIDYSPRLEILSISGDNIHFNENSWTIWRYSGDEMEIVLSEYLRITFNLIN